MIQTTIQPTDYLLPTRCRIRSSALAVVVVCRSIRVGVVVGAVPSLVLENDTLALHLEHLRIRVVIRILIRSPRSVIAVTVVIALVVFAGAGDCVASTTTTAVIVAARGGAGRVLARHD